MSSFWEELLRGFSGLPSRPEAQAARELGITEDEFHKIQREAAETQQRLAEANLEDTRAITDKRKFDIEEQAGKIQARAGGIAPREESIPFVERSFDIPKSGLPEATTKTISHPSQTGFEIAAEGDFAREMEDREREITQEDWARLSDVLGQGFRVKREERLAEGQKAREKYQKGMLEVAERAQSLRERKAEDAQESNTKYPYVTKAMQGLILNRAKDLMEDGEFGPGGQYEGVNVGEWIDQETGSWNMHLDPVSQEFASPNLEAPTPEPPIPAELQETPEGMPVEPQQPQAALQPSPQGVPTINDIPDENIKRQLGENFVGSTEDFEKLLGVLNAEGVFDLPPEQQLPEIQRRLGPFAQQLLAFQDSMEQNGV